MSATNLMVMKLTLVVMKRQVNWFKFNPNKVSSCAKYFKLSLPATWYAKAVAHIPNTWKFAFSSSAATAVESEKKMNVEGKAIRKDHYQTYLKLIVARRWIVCRVLGTWYCPKIERAIKSGWKCMTTITSARLKAPWKFRRLQSHLHLLLCKVIIRNPGEKGASSIENLYSLTNYK